MRSYDPSSWYWSVAGDATRVYSCASGNHVAAKDALRVRLSA